MTEVCDDNKLLIVGEHNIERWNKLFFRCGPIFQVNYKEIVCITGSGNAGDVDVKVYDEKLNIFHTKKLYKYDDEMTRILALGSGSVSDFDS